MMKSQKYSKITGDMSSVVMTNSQASCSLIHLNPSQERSPAQKQTVLSKPEIGNAEKAKSLEIFSNQWPHGLISLINTSLNRLVESIYKNTWCTKINLTLTKYVCICHGKNNLKMGTLDYCNFKAYCAILSMRPIIVTCFQFSQLDLDLNFKCILLLY